MGYKCPKCSEEIPAVSQETLRERLASKDEENKLLKDELKTSKAAAESATTLKSERDRLQGELDKLTRQAERSAAFTAAGVPDTAAVRKVFELVYDSEQAGAEQPVKFEEWLGAEGTKAHPMLSAHLAKPQSGQGQQGQQGGQGGQQGQGGQGGPKTPVKPQGGLAPIDNGATPPPSTDGPKSAAELDAYLRSPEYRALPKEKQRETVAALKQKLSAPAKRE